MGAVFVSNLPTGLASAAGMRGARRSRRYVFPLWGGIAMTREACFELVSPIRST